MIYVERYDRNARESSARYMGRALLQQGIGRLNEASLISLPKLVELARDMANCGELFGY